MLRPSQQKDANDYILLYVIKSAASLRTSDIQMCYMYLVPNGRVTPGFGLRSRLMSRLNCPVQSVRDFACEIVPDIRRTNSEG